MYCRIENKEEKAQDVYNHIKYAEGSYVRCKRMFKHCLLLRSKI